MIGIVDYGMGNLLSVFNAVEAVGGNAVLCSIPDDALKMERLIVPGVGAFGDMMINLRDKGFVDALNEIVLIQKKPVMGICLGMQAMANRSFENGEHKGLGYINADIVRIEKTDANLRIPQVGWNNIQYRDESPIFRGLPENPDFYFVHSYYMECKNKEDIDAVCTYGRTFAAAICKNNICATQFHPEKSQDYGLQVIENFISWKP